jgi:hypothetical protein
MAPLTMNEIAPCGQYSHGQKGKISSVNPFLLTLFACRIYQFQSKKKKIIIKN